MHVSYIYKFYSRVSSSTILTVAVKLDPLGWTCVCNEWLIWSLKISLSSNISSSNILTLNFKVAISTGTSTLYGPAL